MPGKKLFYIRSTGLIFEISRTATTASETFHYYSADLRRHCFASVENSLP